MNYTVRNRYISVIYLGRISYRRSSEFEILAGMTNGRVNRINLNGSCS
jgi:hypothetical protein